jgi:hypothetical protein
MMGFADMTRVTSPAPFGPSEVEGRARAKSRASGAGVSLRSTAVLDFARTERSFRGEFLNTGAAL